jgi:hypothetical protein
MEAIAPSIVKAIRKDYKSLKYNQQQIAEKYGISPITVHRHCQDIDKSALKKEINEIIDGAEHAKLTEILKKHGIDNDLICEKLYKLLNSEDNKDVLNAITQYLKITGQYAQESADMELSKALVDKYKVSLPKNPRDI